MNQALFDDDNEDLSQLDRGDTFDPESSEATPPQPRDEKGRFAAAEDTPDSEDAEGVEDADAKVEDQSTPDDDDDDDEGLENGKIRLNKMRNQRDEARAELERLRKEVESLRTQGKTEETKVDPIEQIGQELDDLYERVEEARLDGDTKAAAQLQREIDAKNREMLRLEAASIASRTTTQASENARFNALLEQLEQRLPQISPDSDEYDEESVKMLDFYVQAHEKMGMQPTEALSRAAQVVFGEAATRERAKPAEKPALTRRGSVERAADTQRRQPPDMSTRGVNSDEKKLDVSQMSDDEFDKLPEAVRARLRGDEF